MIRRVLCNLVFVLVAFVSVSAQTTKPSTKPVAKAPAKPAVKAMTNDDVIQMVKDGDPVDEIIATIKHATKTDFDLSLDAQKALGVAKVPDTVRRTMLGLPADAPAKVFVGRASEPLVLAPVPSTPKIEADVESLLKVLPKVKADSSVSRMTDEQVLAAIKLGEANREKDFMVSCTAGISAMKSFGITMLSPLGSLRSTAAFKVQVFNHVGLIAAIAQQQNRLLKNFALKDVTAEVRPAAIYLFVLPQEGRSPGELYAPIDSIVIRSKAQESKIAQPIGTSAESLGAGSTTQGIYGSFYRSTFSFREIQDLPAGDLEIVLITAALKQTCKLSDKDRLVLSRY